MCPPGPVTARSNILLREVTPRFRRPYAPSSRSLDDLCGRGPRWSIQVGCRVARVAVRVVEGDGMTAARHVRPALARAPRTRCVTLVRAPRRAFSEEARAVRNVHARSFRHCCARTGICRQRGTESPKEWRSLPADVLPRCGFPGPTPSAIHTNGRAAWPTTLQRRRRSALSPLTPTRAVSSPLSRRASESKPPRARARQAGRGGRRRNAASERTSQAAMGRPRAVSWQEGVGVEEVGANGRVGASIGRRTGEK